MSAPVTTIDELVELAEIDLDEWELIRQVPGAWQGQIKGGGVIQLYRIRGEFRKRKYADPERLKGEILDDLAAHSQKRRKIRTDRRKRHRVAEVCLFDIHLGKFCHAEETGADYSLEMASDLFAQTINDVIVELSVGEYEEIVLPIGNDFLHVDNIDGSTTKGTTQDVDAKLWYLARTGRQLLVEAIDDLSRIAPVRVISVPGNHDDASTFFLGEILSAWYRNDSNVTVDSGPKKRKYYRFGRNLIGFSHGKYEGKKLPLLMANEAAKDWAETINREWHLGHVHHLSSKEDIGVRTRTIPSLAAPDAWHSERGYIGSLRAGQVFIWDRDQGLFATLEFSAE